MSELAYQSPGVGIRRVAQLRRAGLALGAFYVAAAVLGTAAGGFGVLAGFIGFFAYMGLPLLMHYQRVSDPSTQTSAGWALAGTVEIRGDEIVLFSGSERPFVAQRGELTDGWIEPFGRGGQRVVLRHRSGDLGVVEVDSLARGHAILEAAGFSADRHALRVRTAGNAGQTLREMALVAAVFGLCVPLVGLAVAEEPGAVLSWSAVTLATLAVVGLLALATRKPVVRVGVDGLEISRGSRRRFVPIADVEGVEMLVHGVQVSLRATAAPPRSILLRSWGVSQAALFARIQEVLRGFGSAQASAAQLARLDRQGRTLAAWREALRGVAADDGGGYRRIGLPREDLARLLAQGDAPAERRIGAALALASSDDPAERERVRVAARACASEELRAALERIAEDEADEAIVDAALRPAVRADG